MFSSFFFQPMRQEHIRRIIIEKLRPVHGNTFYYDIAFGKMFDQLFNDLKSYTNNIDEYAYYFSFLYPLYVQPLVEATSDEHRETLLKKPLSNKKFLNSSKEVLSSLFMHLTSFEEIEKEAKLEDEP